MVEVENPLLVACADHVQAFFEESISNSYVYHDFQHTRYVVDMALHIAEGYELTEKELEIIQLAAWFHDTGYDQGQEGHEERGVAYAREFLKPYNYPEEDLQKIEQAILATRYPHDPHTLLDEIVCDADLSHLGNEWYWDRCGKVRQEMMITKDLVMSDQEWVDFEIGFVTKHNYHTRVAQELFNKQKERHIRQLLKQKQRLNPDPSKDIAEAKKKKKKKKKKGVRSNEDHQNGDHELKQLNLGRGVETMYRTTYRTHVNLSSIADNKANFMLTINSIIISISVPFVASQVEDNPKVVLPTMILIASSLTALVFAILSTRPKVTKGEFTRDDIENKRSNLLFFGNFYNMKVDDFHWGMMEMIKDSDFLYSSMTRDLYYLGIVLAKKYRLLRICFDIFMYGVILSVLVFVVVFLFF